MDKGYIALIPISKFYHRSWRGYEHKFEDLFQENYSFSFKRLGYEIGFFNIRFIKKINGHRLSDYYKNSRFIDGYIEISIDINEQEFSRLCENSPRESLSYLILNRIYNFFIVFKIANPGLFDTKKGFIFINNEPIEVIETMFCNTINAVHVSKKMNWPQIQFIDLEMTWNWYFQNEISIDKISSNSIERAKNAFSFLFTSSPEFRFDEIFWALIALEAIYCDSSNNLQKQLNERTELFLGSKKEFKKSVNKLYQFRSKFIHGDLNIPNRFFYEDMSEEFNKFYGDDYSEYSGLAKAILISTFQKLIIENRFYLEFKTTIVP